MDRRNGEFHTDPSRICRSVSLPDLTRSSVHQQVLLCLPLSFVFFLPSCYVRQENQVVATRNKRFHQLYLASLGDKLAQAVVCVVRNDGFSISYCASVPPGVPSVCRCSAAVREGILRCDRCAGQKF